MSAPQDSRHQRVFFALWPPPAVQDALAALAGECASRVRGRIVARDNLHVTLAFLGEIPPPAVRAVAEAAASVPVEPFVLRLDRLGFWRRPGIVWAGTRECPPPLLELVGALQGRLARLGFPPDDRPFEPHVTLMRRAPRRPRLAPVAVQWPVDGFCLVRSERDERGSVYHVVEQWRAR